MKTVKAVIIIFILLVVWYQPKAQRSLLAVLLFQLCPPIYVAYQILAPKMASSFPRIILLLSRSIKYFLTFYEQLTDESMKL